MTWVVPLALGGLAVLLMAVFTMVSARKRHRQTISPPIAQDAPRILVHDINDDRCTGCDACVAVCPTNVLDLVANKSRVLRFQDCIQCEACMIACPTEALVMFPQGGVPPPLKIPEIDDMFQTVVPGQYLIGEVAGKPLVKNAANLGRSVVEHMLTQGLAPGALGRGETTVDVAIIGSGPGGLSAALTCIQKGLSYVVLEKEQIIASTIARYPKGKLVMAEPYDTVNYSLLPVFDSAKEQLIPIWQELLDRVGIQVRRGESVETVTRAPDGAFDVRTTVSAYRAQRVVLSIGTRGKPRTLQVQGENLPKIYSLLEDPDEWRGRSVLVVGGGDSAVEAALALADAGAKVMISYRGKGFNRAAPRNKQAVESYAAEGRIKAKLGSQVLMFDADSVTLALGDGSQKRYPNDGAFVLIGADPPIAWLEKMGVRFVERPHQHQMGKTDDIVRRFVPRANECPEDAARAAAQVLGGSIGVEPSAGQVPQLGPAAATMALQMPTDNNEISGPRKWLRSATSIFSSKPLTNPGIQPAAATAPRPDPKAQKANKKFDAPVPLSEFAKRSKGAAAAPAPGQSTMHHMHTGHGRRDQLTAGERTRILRMLRDEGGRLADEDSGVYIGGVPARGGYDFDIDDAPSPPPAPSQPTPAPMMLRPDVPAKPALVVGLEQAKLNKKPSGGPSAAPSARRDAPPRPVAPPDLGLPPNHQQAPMNLPPTPPPQRMSAPQPAQRMSAPQPAQRRAVPPPFNDEPTRQVDDQLLSQLRSQQHAGRAPAPLPPPPSATSPSPRYPQGQPPSFNDDPTRMANIDPRTFDEPGHQPERGRYPAQQPSTDPGFENNFDEATSIASLDGIAAMERARHQVPSNEERTRAVNIRNDPSISDIDWDLD